MRSKKLKLLQMREMTEEIDFLGRDIKCLAVKNY
jgi:hypothetical protein